MPHVRLVEVDEPSHGRRSAAVQHEEHVVPARRDGVRVPTVRRGRGHLLVSGPHEIALRYPLLGVGLVGHRPGADEDDLRDLVGLRGADDEVVAVVHAIVPGGADRRVPQGLSVERDDGRSRGQGAVRVEQVWRLNTSMVFSTLDVQPPALAPPAAMTLPFCRRSRHEW